MISTPYICSKRRSPWRFVVEAALFEETYCSKVLLFAAVLFGAVSFGAVSVRSGIDGGALHKAAMIEGGGSSKRRCSMCVVSGDVRLKRRTEVVRSVVLHVMLYKAACWRW